MPNKMKNYFMYIAIVVLSSLKIEANFLVSNNDSPIKEIRDNNWGQQEARKAIEDYLEHKLNTNKANNVILFIAEDMPMSTFMSRRIYKRCLGDPCYDETAAEIFFQHYFKDLAFTKAECYNDVKADVACASTAILTGTKNNKGTIALDHNIKYSEFNDHPHYDNHLHSIAYWAQQAGKRTGLVTTDFLTSPTVSPFYGYSTNDNWQSDYDMKQDNVYARGADLATQMVEGEVGSRLNVILGGGGKKFLPVYHGERRDRRNLIKEWLRAKRKLGSAHAFIDSRDSLTKVSRHIEYLWGLFSLDYMNGKGDPTLAEMTAAAIRLLDQPNGDGYVLLVHTTKEYPNEDFTHIEHAVQQHDDNIEALRVAIEMTDPSETLIVGTTDSHFRNIDVVDDFDEDANESIRIEATHAVHKYIREHTRSNTTTRAYNTFGIRVTSVRNPNNNYEVDSDVCDIRDTGDDSFVFASGPFSHLFGGYIPQYYIAHFIQYAACIGNGLHMCRDFEYV